MEQQGYSSARNVQILIHLLKTHGISKVIVSPGTQNMDFVTSIVRDGNFEIFSSPDERSAAYMACGMAVESGQPVVITCTGATASRNYLSALTEAYYRHIPIVAVTATQPTSWIGNNVAQVIDRRVQPNDTVKCSVTAHFVRSHDDEWDCTLQINKALLELNHHGQGPVHINLERGASDFSTHELPPARVINRITTQDEPPALPQGRIAIFLGAHPAWSESAAATMERFCSEHDAVVFTDQTGNYKGAYSAAASIVASQDRYDSPVLSTDLLIQLGDVSGDYYLTGKLGRMTRQVWRVDPDGKLKDNHHKLTHIFEMDETAFFTRYTTGNDTQRVEQLKTCRREIADVRDQIPELPLSNIWMAQQLCGLIPAGSVLHLGILNSLRAWNFFETDSSVRTYCNTGGFGIDGGVSTLLGASLVHPDKLYFGIYGDLAFFYDMNSLGNRHLGNNVRILLVNNATGVEFKLYSHPASALEDEVNSLIAATGHYGNKSHDLARHYAQDLGFTYLSASSKEEFLEHSRQFTDPAMGDKPLFFEVFVNPENENEALKLINGILVSPQNRRKEAIKGIVGEKTIHAVKRILGK